MDDGQEVVAKVPNPNAGTPHFTTASEVATMEFGSLYYKGDVQPLADRYYVKNGKAVRDSEFTIGLATGRDWFDAGRSILEVQRGRYPHNPGKITGIIYWQSCHISPLFNHNPDPALLDLNGLEPETLDLVPRPKLSGNCPGFHRKNATCHSHSIFSEEELKGIKQDNDGAGAGTELVGEVKERMGDLWPDKGFIEHERYEDCKDALQEVKDMILEQLAETVEEKAEFERYWPFE
ncbi:uncharacterized protein N7473_005536 [Penicillium subrubescens]|nr:uncharacterized protein N7473_005536 [Penicillium subrubescens]KAJ5896137.1 hypothetical protein N7473_005536 [Penicillium subrubescens]